jgi:SAM-dependent methyltransferase
MTSSDGQGHGAETSVEDKLLRFDTTKPNQARVYDYFLDGKDNYAADRAAAEAWLKINPGAGASARANRAFLGRVVRFLAADAGVRQFLDVGSGLPASGNTHEVAQAIAPETRVSYVDRDPVVLTHARALLNSRETGAVQYVDADLRDPAAILGQASQFLDFTRPVALTLLFVLHVIADADDPHALVAELIDALPAGSYLAISHLASDILAPEALDGLNGIRAAREPLAVRSHDQVLRFFDGTDLVDPGVVQLEKWRPEPDADELASTWSWCAVGRKR